jgi:hypothetical protein
MPNGFVIVGDENAEHLQWDGLVAAQGGRAPAEEADEYTR